MNWRSVLTDRVGFMLGGVVALAHCPALLVGPMCDDFVLQAWADEATWRSIWFGHWVEPHLYRPLATATLPTELSLLGFVGARVVTVGLHALVAVALFHLARSLGLHIASSLLAAAWFGLLPIFSTVTVQLAGRSDLLATLGMLMAVASVARQGGHGPASALVWSLIALLSKESAVVLPFVCTLIVAGSAWPRASGQRLRGLAAVWILWLLYLAVHVASTGAGVLRLLRLFPNLFWPTGYTLLDYGLIVGLPLTALFRPWLAWIAPVALLALLVGLWLAVRDGPRWSLFAGLVWMAFALLPVLPYISVISPRNLYSPLVGVALLLGSVAQAVARYVPWRRYLVLPLVAGLLSCNVLLLHLRFSDARKAAREVTDVLAAIETLVPTPAPNALFVVAGLPSASMDAYGLRGHWQFARGLPQALRMRYGLPMLDAVRPEVLPPDRLEKRAQHVGAVYRLRYDPTQRRVIRDSGLGTVP